MDVTIHMQLTGVARVLSGVAELSLTVRPGTSYRDIVHLLGERFPPLMGQVIEADGWTLFPSNLFNLNGTRMIQPEEMNTAPADGDRIVLMSILAGG